MKEEENPKENKAMRRFAIGVVITLIIIFFIIFYGAKWFYGAPRYPTIEYRGFEFQNISGTWYTQWQSDEKLVTIALRYNPLEVENVSVEGVLSEKFRQKQIYITFDPLADDDKFKYLALAGAELGESLNKVFEKEIYASCTKNETEACIDRPIVTCDDTDKAVIFMNAESPAKIILEDNCVTVQGEEFDLLKSVDKLLYIWYRIISVKKIPKNQTNG